jgi:hypothetical protein
VTVSVQESGSTTPDGEFACLHPDQGMDRIRPGQIDGYDLRLRGAALNASAGNYQKKSDSICRPPFRMKGTASEGPGTSDPTRAVGSRSPLGMIILIPSVFIGKIRD